ncbi:hypothetical protein [Methylobacterium indicum]|nr:hypothetical protein [Methylobacterium indicum]
MAKHAKAAEIKARPLPRRPRDRGVGPRERSRRATGGVSGRDPSVFGRSGIGDTPPRA